MVSTAPKSGQVPPLTVEDLALSDYELGAVFLTYFTLAEAEARGIALSEVTPELMSTIHIAILSSIERDARNLVISGAARLAAGGDFVSAGKVVKDHYAEQIKKGLMQLRAGRWVESREKHRKAGRKGASSRASEADGIAADIYKRADKLLEVGYRPHELVRLIAPAIERSPSQIRRILKKRA